MAFSKSVRPLNKLKNTFPYQIAIYGKINKDFLYISEGNSGGHSSYIKTRKKRKIETISLDQVFKTNNIKKCDLIKLDCEGAEYEIIINTSKETLSKINAFALEYHANGNVEDLTTYLGKNGFKTSFGNKGLPTLFASR